MERVGYYKTGLIYKKPDKRDFDAAIMLGNPEEGFVDSTKHVLPARVLIDNTYIKNQGFTNHCSAYGTSVSFESALIRRDRAYYALLAEEQWKNQLEFPGTADEAVGDYTISALKSLRKFGLQFDGAQYHIKSYARIREKSVEGFKKHLAEGRTIITGAFVNRPFADRNHVWIKPSERKYGHLWIIIGYDDIKRQFICQNSWGNRWGDKGYFYSGYEHINSLFASYVLET